VHLAEATTELVVEKSESTATEPTIIPESPVSEEIGAKDSVDKASSSDRNVCDETASKQKSPELKVLHVFHDFINFLLLLSLPHRCP